MPLAALLFPTSPKFPFRPPHFLQPVFFPLHGVLGILCVNKDFPSYFSVGSARTLLVYFTTAVSACQLLSRKSLRPCILVNFKSGCHSDSKKFYLPWERKRSIISFGKEESQNRLFSQNSDFASRLKKLYHAEADVTEIRPLQCTARRLPVRACPTSDSAFPNTVVQFRSNGCLSSTSVTACALLLLLSCCYYTTFAL